MITIRNLIKEIPAGKFHSAVLTSFSINLYYWESQLLRTLSGKGINFVSAIVDAGCLSEQLQKFSQGFIGTRRAEYCLHGYRSKGMFHPKIQFYVGNDAVLVLVGSGNLTLSGHGRNMEVWTSVYVDSTQHPAYPFMRELWIYLKGLYNELGKEADNVVRALEQNCILLQEDFSVMGQEYALDENTSIRLFTAGSRPIFSQCKQWINSDKIRSIKILSPFYDSNAQFIKALHDEYQPKEIDIIVETGFGAPPKSSQIPDYVNIYQWKNIEKNDSQCFQDYFHAKCIFFEGEKFHYLICGSANASVAAFGTPFANSTNHEVGVGFKSSTTDYFKETGFVLREKTDASEFNLHEAENSKEIKPHLDIWIKEASYDGIKYSVEMYSSREIHDATLCFYTGNRQKHETLNLKVINGDSKVEDYFSVAFNPLYVEVKDNDGNVVSNRQFMIPSISMILNDPSTENVSYRRRCHDIESGLFINAQVLQFIERLIVDAEDKITKGKIVSPSNDKINEQKDVHVFLSFEDYRKDNGNGITGGIKERSSNRSFLRSTMLFDSIMSYISKSAAVQKEERIDDEETEDVNHSIGRAKNDRQTMPELNSKRASDIRKRVIAMFDKYIENLPASVKHLKKNTKVEDKLVKPDFYEVLKRFMTAVFFLNRAIGYRFKEEGGVGEKLSLLKIPFNKHYRKTATEYFYRILSHFAFHVINGDFAKDNNVIRVNRIESDKQYAFELCLAVATVCDWINEGNEDYEEISKFCKLPALRNLQKALGVNIECLTKNRIMCLFDKSIQELDGFDVSHLEAILANNVSLLTINDSNVIWTDEFGYVTLVQRSDNTNLAVPHTMISEYNETKQAFCPNYLYRSQEQRLFPIKPKR